MWGFGGKGSEEFFGGGGEGQGMPRGDDLQQKFRDQVGWREGKGFVGMEWKRFYWVVVWRAWY